MWTQHKNEAKEEKIQILIEIKLYWQHTKSNFFSSFFVVVKSLQSIHDRWNKIGKSAIDLFTDFYHSLIVENSFFSHSMFIAVEFFFIFLSTLVYMSATSGINQGFRSQAKMCFQVNSQNNLRHIAKLTSRFPLFVVFFFSQDFNTFETEFFLSCLNSNAIHWTNDSCIFRMRNARILNVRRWKKNVIIYLNYVKTFENPRRIQTIKTNFTDNLVVGKSERVGSRDERTKIPFLKYRIST